MDDKIPPQSIYDVATVTSKKAGIVVHKELSDNENTVSFTMPDPPVVIDDLEVTISPPSLGSFSKDLRIYSYSNQHFRSFIITPKHPAGGENAIFMTHVLHQSDTDDVYTGINYFRITSESAGIDISKDILTDRIEIDVPMCDPVMDIHDLIIEVFNHPSPARSWHVKQPAITADSGAGYYDNHVDDGVYVAGVSIIPKRGIPADGSFTLSMQRLLSPDGDNYVDKTATPFIVIKSSKIIGEHFTAIAENSNTFIFKLKDPSVVDAVSDYTVDDITIKVERRGLVNTPIPKSPEDDILTIVVDHGRGGESFEGQPWRGGGSIRFMFTLNEPLNENEECEVMLHSDTYPDIMTTPKLLSSGKLYNKYMPSEALNITDITYTAKRYMKSVETPDPIK